MFKPDKTTRAVLLALAFPAALLAAPAASAGGTYAPWLKQVGISDSIESAANWGRGQLIITVDTGIQLSNPEFAPGQVSRTLSSCAAVSFQCSSGVNDDNSHGTAVASIAAGNTVINGTINYGGYLTTAGSYIGVAPDANLAAEKVLNAQGTGNSNDVANGIIKAANSGATVINLSLTYSPTANIVAAVNYAASKGVFIVWAGGNSSVALNFGVNTSGLTSTAITHLIFAGSVSSTNKLSSFSNTPGTGVMFSTSGGSTAYDARWIMAPGENIIAPDVTAGPGWFAAWSGTSMSTPVVSGSLALLESAWPILKTNGTAENLLLATATHLGSNSVNTTYGTGLLNMNAAFQPYGGLSITEANGKSIALGGLAGSLITGGALGSLPAIRAKLTNYVALDSYSRNFNVNLSGLIQTKSTSATLNPLPINPNTGIKKLSLADGGEMGLQIVDTPSGQGGLYFGDSTQGVQRSLLVMLSDKSGTTTAVGYGNVMPSSYAYARALYDSDTAALAAENLATDLTALTSGGAQFAYGTKLGENSRFAVSFSNTAMQSQQQDQSQISLSNPILPNWMNPSANTISMGFTQKFSDKLQLGISVRELNENNGLLGSAYDASSSTSFGSNNRTNEFGVSALYKLSDNSGLFFEAAQANTQNSGVASGMFASVNGLTSQSWGVSFVSKAMLNNADHFVFNIKQPLRVNAGTAQMAVTNIDPITGVPSLGYQTVSMAPDGRETDMLATYDTPLSGTQNLSMELGYAKDVMNVAGSNNATVGFNWSMKF